MAIAPEATRETGIAIVGFGKMGQLHMRTFQRIATVDIVGIIDTRRDRKNSADVAGVCFATCIDHLPKAVHAAIVAVPPDQHAQVTVPLLEAGIDCLVEKPIALVPGDAERMVAAAASSGTVLAVGQNERFNANIERALAIIAQGSGTVHTLRCSPFAKGPDQSDVVQDLMVHDLDWVLRNENYESYTATIREVTWQGERLRHVCCSLDFGRRQYELIASHTDGARHRTIEVIPTDNFARTFDISKPASAGQDDPLLRQARSFLDLRQGRRANISTGAQALLVMELVEVIRAQCARFNTRINKRSRLVVQG